MGERIEIPTLILGNSNIIGGGLRFLSEHFQIAPVRKDWATGYAIVECIIGSACTGVTVDRVGLESGLSLCAILFASSSIGVFVSPSFLQFSGWRIVGGLGINVEIARWCCMQSARDQ